MKLIKSTILVSMTLFFVNISAQKYYDSQWKKVEENYKKGTYKSNLPIIFEIQNQATKDNNAIQIIKSLKAEFSILKQTNDDTQNDENSKFFSKLQSTETKLKGDEKQLFHLLTLEFISDYYNDNSWKINRKTNIDNQNLSQIETWSQLDFKNYLTKNYSDLEKENSLLKKIPTQKYKEIFEATENLDYFPTLFDWLNFNYIEFLRNQNLFTPNELKVNSKKINDIYDSEIAANSGNAKLYFQHQKINYNCELNHCKDQFAQLEKLVEDESAKGDYKVLIIDEMIELLQQKDDNKTALVWVNRAKELDPKSKFINNIINKENAIKNPELRLFYEEETQPNKPIHIVAEGKNVKEFSLNIYEVKADSQGFLNYVFDSYKNPFSKVKKSLVRKDDFILPESSDFKSHKTSLELKALPAGIYLAEYVVENSVQGNYYFLVSDSKIIFSKKDDSNPKANILKLIQNENGKAFINENLELTEYVRGKSVAKYTIKTDKSGNFLLPNSANKDYSRNFLVKNGNNFTMIEVYGYDYGNRNKPDNQEIAQIFLDRKIYRPGQIVYFKVIATGIDGETQKVKTLENVKLNITLNDTNDEELQTLKLTTNEFGSVSGSFTLPKNKLNGNFNIEVDNDDDDEKYNISGYADFQVEEYKRPKFEVTFEPIKDEYKYGQTIELKGKAMMFSGVALSNSTVNYEIKKQNIRWRYFWWYPRGNDNENSILGTVKTNEKGEFTIKVELKKDETLEGIQIDNYAINASVTDINGETQSADTNVKVASVSHYITVTDASTPLSVTDYFTNEAVKLTVSTKNYNDQVLAKSYNAKLEKLEEPKQIFRSRFENTIQDLPKLSKEEFVQKFPHDRFDKNEDVKNWKVEKVVFDKIQNTSTPLRVTKNPSTNNQQPTTNLDLGKLEAGTYKLQLYNIEGKDTIKTEQFFKVWDKKSLGKNQKPFLEVIKPKQDFKRGEKAKVFVYSAVGNSLSSGEGWGEALVNVFIQNGKGETVTETHFFKNGILEYETLIPKDETVSRVNLQFQLVSFNDVKTENVDLKIADSKDDLKIETVTFRDKLQPGQKEKWTVKVSGADKNSSTPLRVTAEVLAGMYDKSLDQFASNSWNWQGFYPSFYQSSYDLRSGLSEENFNKNAKYLKTYNISNPQFNWFDGGIYEQRFKTKSENRSNSVTLEEVVVVGYATAPTPMAKKEMMSDKVEVIQNVVPEPRKAPKIGSNSTDKNDLDKIPVRQNLNETAFFYPTLLTGKDGNVSFEFTSPEALTQWKLMFLAHTKDARSATLEKSVVTQKEFSITPNYPRFLREGDELNLQSKLSSLVNQKLNGVAQLQILEAFTNEDISEKFNLNDTQKPFEVTENGNSVVNWKVKVPKDVSSIIIKIVAKSSPLNPLSKGDGTSSSFSDGEQKAIAVLPNRMLVTDALPIFVKEGQTKTFTLENLKNSNSKTLTNVSNTLELTTNPIWEIMFALPSLKNDTNNSADVVFNKWFADVLASEIFKANPKLKTVFDEYQSKGLLTSNLEKNQELKQLLLEETPWVLESKNETEQMEKLAGLFDANTMRNSIQNDWSELQKLQNPDGGFSWYAGYPSSYYNSLYILKNLGRINEWLKGNVADYQSSEQKEMVAKLVSYVDNEVNKYWNTSTPLSGTNENVWNNFVIDYLDTRNYWEKDYPLTAKGKALKTAVISKAKTVKITDFTFFGLHRAALLFDAYNLKDISKKLMTYLKETSTDTETQGVYWKQNLNDWGWYSSKTVNHAGALEAFQKLTPADENFIEEMKIWLVTQKEVNSWGSSRGTAEVIFTILNSGKSWTSVASDKAEISWGGKALNPLTQATGYVKQAVISDNLDKSLATVFIKKDSPGIVQGGLFWQYYEDLDKIKSSESYLSITKELYKKVKTENGEQLIKINENSPLKVGDKVTVRMILNTDRNMEFIHLKDMRAAGFEPIDVISGYEWKNNLGYYQVTKDASTNFYIENMPKGKYVFEYDYVANASGKFSNGITTLQNYYAPQMNAHTQGTRVVITE